MNVELEAIKTAWSQDNKEARNAALARDLSDDYVAAHPAEFEEISEMEIEECVNALGVFRNAGMEDSQWRIQAWLFHHFEPQQIGGIAGATIRVLQEGE